MARALTSSRVTLWWYRMPPWLAPARVVLDSIASEHLHRSVVHLNREMDRQLALAVAQNLAHVVVEAKHVGGNLKLLDGNVEQVSLFANPRLASSETRCACCCSRIMDSSTVSQRVGAPDTAADREHGSLRCRSPEPVPGWSAPLQDPADLLRTCSAACAANCFADESANCRRLAAAVVLHGRWKCRHGFKHGVTDDRLLTEYEQIQSGGSTQDRFALTKLRQQLFRGAR